MYSSTIYILYRICFLPSFFFEKMLENVKYKASDDFGEFEFDLILSSQSPSLPISLSPTIQLRLRKKRKRDLDLGLTLKSDGLKREHKREHERALTLFCAGRF